MLDEFTSKSPKGYGAKGSRGKVDAFFGIKKRFWDVTVILWLLSTRSSLPSSLSKEEIMNVKETNFVNKFHSILLSFKV